MNIKKFISPAAIKTFQCNMFPAGKFNAIEEKRGGKQMQTWSSTLLFKRKIAELLEVD